MHISSQDASAVGRLLQELQEFPSCESEMALVHALKSLAALIGAENAFWIGSTRTATPDGNDIMRGWQPRRVAHLQPSLGAASAFAALSKRYRDQIVDPQTRAIVTGAGARAPICGTSWSATRNGPVPGSTTNSSVPAESKIG